MMVVLVVVVEHKVELHRRNLSPFADSIVERCLALGDKTERAVAHIVEVAGRIVEVLVDMVVEVVVDKAVVDKLVEDLDDIERRQVRCKLVEVNMPFA